MFENASVDRDQAQLFAVAAHASRLFAKAIHLDDAAIGLQLGTPMICTEYTWNCGAWIHCMDTQSPMVSHAYSALVALSAINNHRRRHRTGCTGPDPTNF